MNKKFTVISTVALALVLTGVGCTKVSNNDTKQSPPANSSSVAEESDQDYSWKEQGVSFKYPKGMFIVNQGTRLYFNANSASLPEGESLLFFTRIDVHQNTNVDRVLNDFKVNYNGLKLQTVEKVGSYTFIKVQYDDVVTGIAETHYLLQFGGKVFDYKVGRDDNAENVALTLSSLQF